LDMSSSLLGVILGAAKPLSQAATGRPSGPGRIEPKAPK
jgi:hypothetical protein